MSEYIGTKPVKIGQLVKLVIPPGRKTSDNKRLTNYEQNVPFKIISFYNFTENGKRLVYLESKVAKTIRNWTGRIENEKGDRVHIHLYTDVLQFVSETDLEEHYELY